MQRRQLPQSKSKQLIREGRKERRREGGRKREGWKKRKEGRRKLRDIEGREEERDEERGKNQNAMEKIRKI